jgi:lipopolysaccharide transport system permease protein
LTRDNIHQNSDQWDLIIEPESGRWSLNVAEVVKFRDLLFLFVKRDFVTFYKQTILGPLWFFIQPLLKVSIYYVIFARIANVSTDGVPPILFYLTGLTFWEYFASSWKKTSETFIENQHIFGKVYFPRLVVPISVMISNGIKLGIQFVLFMIFWVYYFLSGAEISIQPEVILLPILILIIALLGLGSGLIVTSLTTKYRDLKFLLDTMIQLLMYVSPIIYPLSLADGVFRKLLLLNPMTSILEALKYVFLGTGVFSYTYIAYSAGFAVALVICGMLVFQRTERNFIDTV